MIKKLYHWLYRRSSKPEERGGVSAGHWQGRVRDIALELCTIKEGNFLEIGCGEGLFIYRLAEKYPKVHIVGIDKNTNQLKRANKRVSQQQFMKFYSIAADASSLPVKSGYFDVIVCINMLYNVPSGEFIEGFIKEIARVCKVGGRAIFDYRNALNPLINLRYKLAPYYDETIRKKKTSLTTYTPRHIENIVEKSRLKIKKEKYLGFPRNRLSPIIIIEAEKC